MSSECINVLGLTGPSGSGKGMAASVFEEYGFKIVDADKLAREAVDLEDVRNNLKKRFGDDIYENDVLDRKKLAGRAFSDKKCEKDLNDITHGAIIELTKRNIRSYIDNGECDILYDAPLLFEADADSFCTAVISVIADRKKRIERIMLRDGISEEEAFKRISVQQDDDYYIQRSEYVIYNNGSVEDLRGQVLKIIKEVQQ